MSDYIIFNNEQYEVSYLGENVQKFVLLIDKLEEQKLAANLELYKINCTLDKAKLQLTEEMTKYLND